MSNRSQEETLAKELCRAYASGKMDDDLDQNSVPEMVKDYVDGNWRDWVNVAADLANDIDLLPKKPDNVVPINPGEAFDRSMRGL